MLYGDGQLEVLAVPSPDSLENLGATDMDIGQVHSPESLQICFYHIECHLPSTINLRRCTYLMCYASLLQPYISSLRGTDTC